MFLNGPSKRAKKQLYGCFLYLFKAFYTVPREHLLQRFHVLKIPSDMMWTMFAWYEQVLEWVSHPWSLSEVITNTICVKQGCKLSSTLFGLCINEVADCIMHGDYEGINILDTPIHILLYADDIFFITESQWGPEILYIVMNRELGTIVGFLSSKSWFSHDVQWNGNCSEVLGSQDMTLPWPMEWEMW